MDKKHGGMWEPTSGCVKKGETSIEGIQREINEEIGIYINESEFKLLKTEKEKRKEVNIFRDTYIVNKNIALSNISFNDGEVIGCKYVTIQELEEMIKSGEIFEWFNYLINDYYKIIKNI